MFRLDMLGKVRRSRNGWHTANCPVCGNKRFGAKEGDKGWIFNCWEGCTVQEICDTLGLKMTDLFWDDLPDRPRYNFDPEIEQYVLAQAVSAKKAGKPVTGKDRERAIAAVTRLRSVGLYDEVMRKLQ